MLGSQRLCFWTFTKKCCLRGAEMLQAKTKTMTWDTPEALWSWAEQHSWLINIFGLVSTTGPVHIQVIMRSKGLICPIPKYRVTALCVQSNLLYVLLVGVLWVIYWEYLHDGQQVQTWWRGRDLNEGFACFNGFCHGMLERSALRSDAPPAKKDK